LKIKTKKDRRERIHLRLRQRLQGTAERPRVTVFRSLVHISVQAVDDEAGRTLVSASTTEPALKARLANGARGGNLGGAKLVGEVLAERLRERGISQVVFDRSGYLYHGRVKAVADAARGGGLQF
jgi:large subunit ribosomal protein L18